MNETVTNLVYSDLLDYLVPDLFRRRTAVS